jgi:hypothetical protein
MDKCDGNIDFSDTVLHNGIHVLATYCDLNIVFRKQAINATGSDSRTWAVFGSKRKRSLDSLLAKFMEIKISRTVISLNFTFLKNFKLPQKI